jgi:zinc protease
MKTIAALLVSIGIAALTLGAQAPPADVPAIDIEKYTLSNGLEVILSEDRRLPIVGVNLWYHVGPAHEAPGRTGFAHLFEHMMFQGSKQVSGDSHFRLLEGAGATGMNGTTDFDRTNYFETVPTSRLELALWLESDRMGYLLDVVDQAKLSNQQDVVRNERRQSTENAPYGIVEEARFKALYPAGHPYHGVVIGSHADIQAAKLEDVRGFFRQYYAPNNRRRESWSRSTSDRSSEVRRFPRQARARLPSWASGALSSRIACSCRACTCRGTRRPTSRTAMPTPTSPRACSGRAGRAGCTRSWCTKSRSRRT